MVILQMALLVLMTPSLASGLISGERESGGWQLMQMTPMSPWTIVMGKLMSVAWTVILILLATLPGYGLMIVIDESQAIRVFNVLITLALTAVFVVLVSAWVSSLFKRTAVATATAYALVVGLCAGTMLFWMGQDAPFNRSTVEFVLLFNPLAAGLQLIEAPGFADYRLVPGNWWIIGSASLACLLGLLYRTWRLARPS
ncbi:MAG: ABC transporter permease [Phycisphaerales bacterium]|nr:ABC transporter permease [Phycisphaerales bacterium]